MQKVTILGSCSNEFREFLLSMGLEVEETINWSTEKQEEAIMNDAKISGMSLGVAFISAYEVIKHSMPEEMASYFALELIKIERNYLGVDLESSCSCDGCQE